MEGGRGHFWLGRRRFAYRVAYELTKGPIPPGQVVRHMCHTPLCVNPAHLEVGTQRQNVHDTLDRTPRRALVVDVQHPTSAEQFWALVDKGECWTWLGATSSTGHPQVLHLGQYVNALRLCMDLLDTAAAPGARHEATCGNRLCIRPEHQRTLQARKRDPRGDAWRAGRDVHPNAKMTPEEVVRMRAMHAEGVSVYALAQFFDVTRMTIGKLLAERSVGTRAQRHVRGPAHPASKFTAERALEVRLRRRDGSSLSALAREYAVNIKTIRSIVEGDTYAEAPCGAEEWAAQRARLKLSARAHAKLLGVPIATYLRKATTHTPGV